MILDDEGGFEKISRFLPDQSFLSPQDLKFGPDGSLYTLEWGGGFGRDNPNSSIYRIDYIYGSRSPIAQATVTPDNGQEPLTVALLRHRLRPTPRAGRSPTRGTSTATGSTDSTDADRLPSRTRRRASTPRA